MDEIKDEFEMELIDGEVIIIRTASPYMKVGNNKFTSHTGKKLAIQDILDAFAHSANIVCERNMK